MILAGVIGRVRLQSCDAELFGGQATLAVKWETNREEHDSLWVTVGKGTTSVPNRTQATAASAAEVRSSNLNPG